MANPWMDPEYVAAWVGRVQGGNPLREHQIGVVCRLADVGSPRRILELGIGTGAVARRLLARLPDASLTGLDGSAAMLERAEANLKAYDGRVSFVTSLLEEDWPARTGGDYDLVVSVQAMHHVPGEAKRDCYEKAFRVLKPGGRFLVSDRLAIDPRLFELYRALWDRARDRGDFERVSPEFTRARYEARLAENGDVPDRLETQLAWLRDVGFDPVDCFWLDGDRAVFGGLKAP